MGRPELDVTLWNKWSSVLVCPNCRGFLEHVSGEAVSCRTCGGNYPIRDGLLSLIKEDDAASWEAFSRRYSEKCRLEGCLRPGRSRLCRLPFRRPPGGSRFYWTTRKESYLAFMRILGRQVPAPAAGLAADLGAGWGWLGFRLYQLGYRVLALDVNRDRDYGLGLAADTFGKHEHFLPLQADFSPPPVRKHSLSLAVFNASLHHADRTEETLKSIERKLQPGGILVIMDTPLGKKSVKAAERGFRCLGKGELVSTLQKLHLSVRIIPVRRGWRWAFFQIRSRLKKRIRFSFPIIAAWKAK